MTNEATLLFELQHAIPFTVADGTAITKGALLTLSDPMTASTCVTANQMIAGIASSDKIANDGVTKLGVFRSGIFKMFVSGGVINVGQAVTSAAGANYVMSGSTLVSGSAILGYALETGVAGESIMVDLNIGSGNHIS